MKSAVPTAAEPPLVPVADGDPGNPTDRGNVTTSAVDDAMVFDAAARTKLAIEAPDVELAVEELAVEELAVEELAVLEPQAAATIATTASSATRRPLLTIFQRPSAFIDSW
ncbi:MAG: hypothetical protein ACYDEY_01590 [Acidimicrobiales bacterium]